MLQIGDVTRVQHVGSRRYECHMRVAHVVGASAPAELSNLTRQGIEGSNLRESKGAREHSLLAGSAPDLRKDAARNDDVLPAKRRDPDGRPDPTLVSLERNQCACVENDRAHPRRFFLAVGRFRVDGVRGVVPGRLARARCCRLSSRRSSSSVILPCTCSQSRTSSSKPSARNLRRAASASHVEVGSPAADLRTRRASSRSSEIANFSTVIP